MENRIDRSEAKRDYKQTKRPMGVYRIRNTRNGKSYVGFSTDLQARMNRQKAELRFGSHRNAELLSEWKSFGEASFEFEILDELAHDDNAKADPAEELRILAEMWVHKLEGSGSPVVSL
ncbi:MAG: GIY-YIG nuclease family protein [Desulfobacterales bacterium]